MDETCGKDCQSPRPIHVQRALLEQLRRRCHDGARKDHAAAAHTETMRVPRSWVERLQHELAQPQLEVELPKQSESFVGADTWLAKLRTENLHADLARSATQHRSPEAVAVRREVQSERATQSVEEHFRSSMDFLKGPRQLRDRFGSSLAGTDCTADVVLQEVADLRTAMLADVADLCRRSRAARLEEQLSEPPSPGIRRRAIEALEDSDRLLAACNASHARVIQMDMRQSSGSQ